MEHIILLWRHLSRRRKNQFYILYVLMLFASAAEVASIGMVVPFLSALTSPDSIYQYAIIKQIAQHFGIFSPDQILLPITIIFIILAFFSGVVRLGLLFFMTRLSFATGADFSVDIYRRTLHQEYSVHLGRNSSEVINGITSKTGTVINGVLTPSIMLINSAVLLMGITGALFFINAQVALVSTTGFGILYFGVAVFAKTRVNKNSKIIAKKSNLVLKSLQEGLGGIRDVLIDGSQRFYCGIYKEADAHVRKAAGSNIFIAGSPRYVMESIGMSLIALLAFYLTTRLGGIESSIPILGALALGAQRMIPALQQVYGSYSSIRGAKESTLDVLSLLDQPFSKYLTNNQHAIPFEDEIYLKNVSFRYSDNSPWIINNINLKISKGERIGFIGETGSGKSTLFDVVMGLLSPTKGEIYIDGKKICTNNKRGWQKHISHVPQNIFLFDSTIEENIAFGINKKNIDRKRLISATKNAQISTLLDELPEGYQTKIGEKGVRISGGQRQRIGVARALYKNTDVLVFDEATSALDSDTELALMKSIEGLNRDFTILIIAHRLSTLNGCDRVIKLYDGSIISGSYDIIVNNIDT